nr:hypothetical protein [Mycoplasmopsis bovis]
MFSPLIFPKPILVRVIKSKGILFEKKPKGYKTQYAENNGGKKQGSQNI